MSNAEAERLLNTKEAAEVLGLSPRTLEEYRWRGGGPRYLHLSRNCIRYRHSDLIEWANARGRLSTTDAFMTDRGLAARLLVGPMSDP